MKIRIKEAEPLDPKAQDVLDDIKGQMSALLGGIEDAAEEKNKEQKEDVGTTVGLVLALPAILGLIARFGKATSGIIRRKFGTKPTEQSDSEKYFYQMGRLADELHRLYMKPLELIVRRFVKDKTKAEKVAHFIWHVILGVMLLSAGVIAVKAIQSRNISLATLETAIASIKGGEVKNYINKLLA